MFIHVFGFRWKEHATAAEKERAARDIRAFQGVIPDLIEVFVGENISPRGQGYAFAGVMKLDDRAACDAYATNPAHLALLAWLVPLIEPLELDFDA